MFESQLVIAAEAAFPLRDAWEAVFDADALEGPLAIRAARRGERITIFGGGSKKVSDIYIDAKIPRQIRYRRPVVADDRGVIWLPGLARSALAPLTTATRLALQVKVESSESSRDG